MPLKAYRGEQELLSFLLSEAEFSALRGDRALRMACCDVQAIPKRSSLGTPFFAHARRGECASGPETAFHIDAKVQVARAALAAGWTAEVEATGHTPDGARWRADVLCTRGTQWVAFEVQCSPQTMEETEARQALYRESGVRGLWFMTRHRVTLRERAKYRPQEEYRTPIFWLDAQARLPRFDLDLPQFVQRALTGGLVFFPRRGQTVEMTVLLGAEQCRKCWRSTRYVAGARYHLDADNVIYRIWDKWEVQGERSSMVTRYLPPERLAQLEVALLPWRKGQQTYLMSRCFHCDSPLFTTLYGDERQALLRGEYRAALEVPVGPVIWPWQPGENWREGQWCIKASPV